MTAAVPSPAAPSPQTPPGDTLALARRLVDLAKDKRAEDPVLLDVRTLVDYTDFFLILTGTTSRQNQAIGEHLARTMKGEGHRPLSKAGLDTGSWICIDLGDVVVHVFDPETRARYDLELLWADAPRIDLEAPEAAAAPEAAEAKPKRRRRVVRKAAVADADAENAPDSERPPEDEPEAPAKKAPVKKPAAKKPAAAVKKAPAKRSRGRDSTPAAKAPRGRGRKPRSR